MRATLGAGGVTGPPTFVTDESGFPVPHGAHLASLGRLVLGVVLAHVLTSSQHIVCDTQSCCDPSVHTSYIGTDTPNL